MIDVVLLAFRSFIRVHHFMWRVRKVTLKLLMYCWKTEPKFLYVTLKDLMLLILLLKMDKSKEREKKKRW